MLSTFILLIRQNALSPTTEILITLKICESVKIWMSISASDVVVFFFPLPFLFPFFPSVAAALAVRYKLMSE